MSRRSTVLPAITWLSEWANARPFSNKSTPPNSSSAVCELSSQQRPHPHLPPPPRHLLQFWPPLLTTTRLRIPLPPRFLRARLPLRARARPHCNLFLRSEGIFRSARRPPPLPLPREYAFPLSLFNRPDIPGLALIQNLIGQRCHRWVEEEPQSPYSRSSLTAFGPDRLQWRERLFRLKGRF